MPALQAFERISLFRVSGAAVVDEHGRLVDTLTATDMRVRFPPPRSPVVARVRQTK